MCRESRLIFAVVANAMMGLGAFGAVILGDVNLVQVATGVLIGFVLSFPAYWFICADDVDADAVEELPDWYVLHDAEEVFGSFRDLVAA